MKINGKHPSKKLISITSGVIVLIAIVAGLVMLNNRNSDSPATASVITRSTDDPSEEEIPDDYNWKGKDSDPKLISMPSIKTKGFFQNVSVDQRKEVGVPNNIHLAGWFIKSSIPGEKGLSVVDGHVDGKNDPGIFKNLGKLKKGATFEIEYGSGDKQKFKVMTITTINKNEAPSVLFSQDPTQTSQLNLITCGGSYDKKARHYNDRIIVSSVPIK